MKVKFLPLKDLEAITLCLLAEYGRKYGVIEHPPIPVSEILESHFELRVDYDDLPKRIGIPDVLGATWIREKHVIIDQTLDPTVFPSMEGRCNFTAAHEAGHWELHRHHFLGDLGQRALFDTTSEPSIVCRTSSRKEPMEWQADAFAGFLLMPKEMVYRAWESLTGKTDPYIAEEEIANLSAKWGLAEDKQPTVEISRWMADEFKVSGQAMQIRLLNLGLIKTKKPAPDLLSRLK